MITCTICKQNLDESAFRARIQRPKALYSACRECMKSKAEAHRREMRAWVNEWKEKEGCSKCGFMGKHYQLDLDHVDPNTKYAQNHRAYEPNWIKERIETEIAKCVILCANCHREKTFTNSDHLRPSMRQSSAR